jgi:hypothetical protein
MLGYFEEINTNGSRYQVFNKHIAFHAASLCHQPAYIMKVKQPILGVAGI